MMKKMMAAFIALCLMLTASCFAEQQLAISELANLDWSFSSGVGGWSTDLHIQADGSFSGEYHDSEMGETGKDYPEGTLYHCSFHGQLSLGEQLDENSWKIRIDKLETEEAKEEILDNIRFVPSVPYGLSEGDEMILYKPGTPMSVFTEEMVIWTHVYDQDTSVSELQDWFLTSEKNGSGFLSYPSVSMVNPWTDATAEEAEMLTGKGFGIPDGAKDIIYRCLNSESLAEMQFTIDDDEYCARIIPKEKTDAEGDQTANISGMYFQWENEEKVQIGDREGTLGLAQTGSEEWVELCMWSDEKFVYSLSVYTTDPDGLDLTAVAAQI